MPERLLEDRSRSAPSRSRPRPCCCGTCSSDPPGRSRSRGRSGGDRSPSAGGSWRCSTPRPRRPRCRRCRSPRRRRVARRRSVTVRPESSVSRRRTSASTSSVTFGRSRIGPHRDRLRVRLGVHETRVAVTPGAADARALRPVGLVEQDPARRGERVVPARRQVVDELLDARLVGDRGPRVLLAPVALGGVLAVRAVHLVQPLGLRVVRLEVVVAHRPRRREAVDVVQLAEVLRPQPVQRGAVELRRAAHVVVHLRLERGAVVVVPGLLGHVPAVDEDRARIPVRHLARQEVAALEQQDPLAGVRQRVGERAAAGAGPDDDRRRSGRCS